jgi:CRISPR/Cas system-associated exonuclease Cas4 (RecB family)
MNNPPIALSYSRLSDYEQCPLKFKSKYITKDYPDDSNNPAFAKGTAIHKQLEEYILAKKSEKDKPLMGQHAKNVVPMIDRLFENCTLVMAEKQLAVDLNWNQTDWFSKPDVVKYRAIIDMIAFYDSNTVLIADFKSGKFRDYSESETSQLNLTAAMIFSLYPDVNKVTSIYLYVEHKQTVKVEFVRSQLDELKEPFDRMYNVVQSDEVFAHKKNQYCAWCQVASCPIK